MVKQGKAFGTTGPLIDVQFDTVLPGGTFQGSKGELKIIADSADWIDIDELRVFINGEKSHVMEIKKRQPVVLDLSFEKDSFITVEVSGGESSIYSIVAPGFTPLAFSNPIFIDVEGDGYTIQ